VKKRIGSFVVFLFVLFGFVFALGELSTRATEEGAANLASAIQKSTVQCYAVEGRYPASVDYLVKHYGIQIDDKKYVVFYEGFASNIMPEITVSVR